MQNNNKFTAVTLEITKRCNHRCEFCYNAMSTNSHEVTYRQIDFVIDKLHQYGIERVTVTGGEPYVIRNKTEYLINKLLEYHFDVCLNTNLTLIKETDALFLEKTIGHDNTIYSSIPSVVEKHCDQITKINGSYQNIIRGLELCRKHHLSVGLNMTVSQRNIDDLVCIPDFLRKYPVDSFTLFPVVPPISDRDNQIYNNDVENIIKVADTLYNIHKEFGIIVGSIRPLPMCIIGDEDKYKVIRGNRCTTGIDRFAIDLPSGEIEACSQENKTYGNIYANTIESAYEKMYQWRKDKMLADICRECDQLQQCGGMCLWSDPCGRC